MFIPWHALYFDRWLGLLLKISQNNSVWHTTVHSNFLEGNNEARINCHRKWVSSVSDGGFPFALCSLGLFTLGLLRLIS